MECRSRLRLPVGGAGPSKTANAAVIAGGAALAVVIDAVVNRLLPQHSLSVASSTLVAAAAVYPLARRQPEPPAAAAREWFGVAAAIGTSGLSHLIGRRGSRALVAAGWAAHAVFDLVHDRGRHSRLPNWYPPLCAAYDVTLVGLILARPADR